MELESSGRWLIPPDPIRASAVRVGLEEDLGGAGGRSPAWCSDPAVRRLRIYTDVSAYKNHTGVAGS